MKNLRLKAAIIGLWIFVIGAVMIYYFDAECGDVAGWAILMIGGGLSLGAAME